MRRIDENTYIDDTLVTCAEYQLFIDEMREQGKYYQPDHWTSYQFPAGQAREPILGVRHSDAVTFCEWLTWHDLSGWEYQLPTMEKAKEHPVKIKQSPLGHWSINIDNQSQFMWIGSAPINPRGLDLDIDRARDIAHAIDNVSTSALDLDKTNAINHVSALYRGLDLESLLNRALANIGSDRTDALNLTIGKAFEIASDRSVTLDFVDTYFGIYIDLFTLQERIAGRSPAFEGIRLVKERIR